VQAAQTGVFLGGAQRSSDTRETVGCNAHTDPRPADEHTPVKVLLQNAPRHSLGIVRVVTTSITLTAHVLDRVPPSAENLLKLFFGSEPSVIGADYNLFVQPLGAFTLRLSHL